MALLARSADYSNRDFDALLARLHSAITSVFPTWTDFDVANFINVLLESGPFVGDVLGYYQDNQAAEAFIPTVTQRANILKLVKLINFTPAGAAAATVSVMFTLSTAVLAGRTVTFRPPAEPTPTNPTVVKTLDADSPVEFQLTAEVVIVAGQTQGSGIVEHSENQGPETFAASGVPDQEIALAQTPYLDGSAVIAAGNGAYTVVANLLSSGPSDRHCTVVVDDDDRATFRFGDGVTGAIPTGDITFSYKTGGGLAGIVAAGTILKIEGNFVDSAGDPVTVTVTNAAASTGGSDRDSIEAIREEAPASVRSLTRTVSKDDFENHAKLVAGIERALMMTRNEDATIAENTGRLIVVPSGIGFPTTALKNAVLTMVTATYPHTITFSPSVVAPTYLDIGVNATIFLKQGYVAATVRSAILTALTDFFALRLSAAMAAQLDLAAGATNPLIDFGANLKTVTGAQAGEVALSDVFNVVRDVDGVRKVGDEVADFQLNAYRVIEATTHYSGGAVNAVLVQAFDREDVPIALADFPRLKKTTIGGAVLDVDLTIDGVNYPPA